MAGTEFQTIPDDQNSKLKTDLFGSFGMDDWDFVVIWDLKTRI